MLVVVDLDFTMLVTSQVISIAFYVEREKSDKFCSEALISASGSFTCRKSTTRDSRLYFPSEGSHTHDFYSLKKIHRPRLGLNPRTSDPVASVIRLYNLCTIQNITKCPLQHFMDERGDEEQFLCDKNIISLPFSH